MDFILRELQSNSYAFILMLQIAVVGGLALFLIGIFLRKLKQSPIPESKELPKQNEKASEVDVKSTQSIDLSKYEDEIEKLRKQVSGLENESKGLIDLKKQLELLIEDKGELERKLNEYSIVEKEIIQVSELKKENQDLRDQLKNLLSESSADAAPKPEAQATLPAQIEGLINEVEGMAKKTTSP